MRHVRSIALVLLSACGGYKMSPSHQYVAAPAEMPAPYPSAVIAGPAEETTGEQYTDWGRNPWVDASKDHLSTFAADVDTASYTLARRKLNEGTLPVTAAIRVEEFVNYFGYAFRRPQPGHRSRS